MRIVVGGISHETNTFNPIPTSLNAFKRGDEAAKAILRKGDEVIRFLSANGVNVIPTFYADALPSGPVEEKAYLHMKEELLRRIESAGEIDGVCLSLHGAMEVKGIGDGESDLVKSVRAAIGQEPLISVSLDLHGNIFPELVEHADILTAYRTAPHVDATETRVKAASLLLKCLKNRIRPVPVIVKPSVMLPGEFVVTDTEPASTLYHRLEEIDRSPGILDSSLLVGMAWADHPYTGASVLVLSEKEKYKEDAYQKACELAEAYWNKRKDFHLEVESGSIEGTIRIAKEFSRRPVFISDSGDNVTAGAAGDTTLFVEQLISMKVKDAVVGGIVDPEAVEKCKEAGVGNKVRVEIGGKIDRVNGYPLEVKGKVMSLSEEGAVLRADEVDVILTARRRAFVSLENFRRFGINPLNREIIVVKLGYLFPELRKSAALSLMALSPGFTNLRLDQLSYQRVKRPIFPLDQNFSWKPSSY